MNGKIGDHCPKDVMKMPKIGDKFYCSFCDKNVVDFTNENNIAVIQKIQEAKSSICIHIQKSRLSLVTTKFPKWRIFIFALINFKVFFLQKLYAQNNDSLSINKSHDKIIIKKLKGQIEDSYTGRPIKKPTIELYRGQTKLQTLTGDRDGRFAFLIESTANFTDTVSLVISSKHYKNTSVSAIPLFKKTTSLKTTITKNNKKSRAPETFTGERFLD